MHKNTEQRENKEVSRLMSHPQHRITYKCKTKFLTKDEIKIKNNLKKDDMRNIV
jgi:hypothetical protein